MALGLTTDNRPPVVTDSINITVTGEAAFQGGARSPEPMAA
jgi:hypothetical protein